jgi:L-fucose isomerase-like protein
MFSAKQGEVIEGREELIARSTACFPHAVVQTGMDIGKFIKTYGSNHIHAVAGDYRKELRELKPMFVRKEREELGNAFPAGLH